MLLRAVLLLQQLGWLLRGSCAIFMFSSLVLIWIVIYFYTSFIESICNFYLYFWTKIMLTLLVKYGKARCLIVWKSYRPIKLLWVGKGGPKIKKARKYGRPKPNPYEALHRLDYTSDPKKTLSQGHCSKKLDIKLTFVYHIILS